MAQQGSDLDRVVLEPGWPKLRRDLAVFAAVWHQLAEP